MSFLTNLNFNNIMQTIKQNSTKISAFIFALLFTFTMIIPLSTSAQEGGSGDRVLRSGHCWLDGKPNCRKKREGTECTERHHCSAEAYVKVAGIIAGVLIKKD
jgi:hypothetical protein